MPCESIDFNDIDFDSEETWFRLVSFAEAGFPMGCATDTSGEGVVGMHAYSLLEIRELSDVNLGTQTTMENYFSSHQNPKKDLKKNDLNNKL